MFPDVSYGQSTDNPLTFSNVSWCFGYCSLKSFPTREADDETSAGSARSPHDTDTEQSEADERRNAHAHDRHGEHHGESENDLSG